MAKLSEDKAKLSEEKAKLSEYKVKLSEEMAKLSDEKGRLEKELRDLKEVRACKICYERDMVMVFLPCGHQMCCDSCSYTSTRTRSW